MYLTVIFGPTFHSLKIFKLQLLCMCIYVCVGRCGHATSWEWRSGDSFEVWVLIFSYVGPGAGAQVGGKCPHSLSQAFPFAPCSLILQAHVRLFPFLVESSTLPSFLLSAPRVQFIPLHFTTQPTCNLRSPLCHRRIQSGRGKLQGCDCLGL